MTKNTNNITFRIVTISPDMARAFLLRNTSNRKIGGRNLEKIKASLLRGEWELNGEAIKIANDGTILDGQHRLVACAETDVSFQTLIVEGVAQSTQHTMDSGKSRTFADVLTLNGHKNGTSLAAAIVGIVKSEKYSLKTAFTSGGIGGGAVTIGEVLERIAAEPTIADSATAAGRLTKIGLQGRTASVLHYVLTSIDADDASDFFSKLQTGEGLVSGSPILALRNLLMANRSSTSSLPQTHLAALAIKAWNKYRSGETVKLLKFTVGGANPESFPEPK